MTENWIKYDKNTSALENHRKYLCLCKFFNGDFIPKILWYSNNLYMVDKFEFQDKKGTAGFYEYDREYGNTEYSVSYYMPIPDYSDLVKKGEE